MVFNTTFNNISVISWWSVLLVEETREKPHTNNFYFFCLLNKSLYFSYTHLLDGRIMVRTLWYHVVCKSIVNMLWAICTFLILYKIIFFKELQSEDLYTIWWFLIFVIAELCDFFLQTLPDCNVLGMVVWREGYGV